MSRLSYDTAETLVYDPVSGNRNATRAALYSLGFRSIETVGTVDAFADCVRRRAPDLAVCEAQGTDNALCDAIQGIRQGLSVYNPFIVIIVTSWEQSSSLVSKVLNSGADDLLLRPFSTATLGARVRLHIERRKGFVITSDYVGPDRRRDPARPSNTDLFEPPNSLRMKTCERLSPDVAAQRLESELRSARDVLTAEKLRRDAFQVCVLWRMMQETPPQTPSYQVDMSRLKDYARAIAKRCRDTEFDGAGSWCESILAAVDGIDAGADRNASLHLLGHAALNLISTFSPDKTDQEHLREVNTTVALVKARLAAPLAS